MFHKVKKTLSLLSKNTFKDGVSNIKKTDILFFCHDVDRGLSLEGKAYSPIIDSLKEEAEKQGFKTITIARPWSKITDDKGYGNPISINRSYFFSSIIDGLFVVFKANFRLRLYERIINKSRPAVIVTIGCEDSLCEAARNLNVLHAEILHGIGYTPIPWGWGEKDKKYLPQVILSLDKISTQTFSGLEGKGVIVKQIAHPFLSRFDEGFNYNIPKEWLPDVRSNKHTKEVLITLQWGYVNGVDASPVFEKILDNGLIFEELLCAIRKSNESIFWRFRLHPVQLRQPEKYSEQFALLDEIVASNKNCEWKESTRLPLPSVLKNCSAHITMNSMCSYEAAYMGIPSLALCPTLRKKAKYENMFSDLIESGYLTKMPANAESILDWVNSTKRMPPLINSLKEYNGNKETLEWLFCRAKSYCKDSLSVSSERNT